MPTHRTQADRDNAVQAYLNGEKATEIVARLKISRPAFYQWLAAYNKHNPDAGRRGSMGRALKRAEALKNETQEQKIARLQAENDRLRKRLFELMIETGRL
jgi:transposase-like protein